MKEKIFKIAVFPGDGIGSEIVREALKCLTVLADKSDVCFHIREGLVGGTAIDSVGVPLPESSLALARASDAVLLGGNSFRSSAAALESAKQLIDRNYPRGRVNYFGEV